MPFRKRFAIAVAWVWSKIFGGDVVYFLDSSERKIYVKIASIPWNPFDKNPKLLIKVGDKRLILGHDNKVLYGDTRERYGDRWMYVSKSKRVEMSLKNGE